MADYGKGNQPPPYPNQQWGQANYGFSQPPPPPPQQQQPQMGFHSSSNTNVVVTQAQQGYTVVPIDYTTQSLIACLCCFWPTGILAMMKASESRDALARGDVAAAHSAANSARTFVRISWAIGLCSTVGLGIILGVYYGAIVSSYNYNDY